jgi:hypothetical protein
VLAGVKEDHWGRKWGGGGGVRGIEPQRWKHLAPATPQSGSIGLVTEFVLSELLGIQFFDLSNMGANCRSQLKFHSNQSLSWTWKLIGGVLVFAQKMLQI